MRTPEGDGRSGHETDWRSGLRQAAPLLGLGMQMALTMAMFAGGGYWLDRKLGTSPLLTVLGSVLAIAALGLLLARVLKSLDQRQDGD